MRHQIGNSGTHVNDRRVSRPPCSGRRIGRYVGYLATIAIAAVPLTAACEGASNSTNGPLPPRSNAVWIYDPWEKDAPGQRRNVIAGAHVQALSDYNRKAGEAHRLTMFYSMGGSTEIYCRKRGTPEQTCRDRDLVVTYDPAGSGHRSAKAYREGVEVPGSGKAIVTPIIDGLIKADYEGSMKGFDQLSKEDAERLADKVSERICADPMADGVQFDIEPFNVDEQYGQFHFYMRIAGNFAGATGDFGCVSDAHPHGRFFSIFTTARRINPETESARNVARILNTHGNGYLVGALYDLGEGPPGTQTSLEEYRRLVTAEVRNMHAWAAEQNISYQHGIPAAAGYHEFERCRGPRCNARDNGPTQLDYVKVALEAIHSQPDTERFLGVVLWAWGASLSIGPTQLYPGTPSADVRAYLADNLGKEP